MKALRAVDASLDPVASIEDGTLTVFAGAGVGVDPILGWGVIQWIWVVVVAVILITLWHKFVR